MMGASNGQAGEADINLYGQFGTGTPAIEGEEVEDLISAEAFPQNPAVDSANPPSFFPLEPLTSLQWPQDFAEADNSGDNYGSMVEGFLEVPQAGKYTFFVRSDDASQFLLSSDHQKSNAEVVAEEPDCCNDFVDDGIRSSDPIELEPGNQYYFQLIHKEGAGNDWWQVGWSGPGIADEPTVIDGRFFQRFVDSSVLEITKQPESKTVVERNRVVFEANVDAQPPVDYQWKRGDGSNIEGAVNSSLGMEATLADDGSEFMLEISNSAGTKTTDTVTLQVDPDETPPEVANAVTQGNPNGLRVTFSEAVSEETAGNPDNYSISGGVTVNSVTVVNRTTVQLETTEITSGQVYTVTVNNVEDLADDPNEIGANNSMDFLQVHGVITRKKFEDVSGTDLGTLRNAEKFPDNPDVVDYPTLLETPVNVDDNYGVQFQGFFTPPETGEYVFYISSDDQGELFLSSDEDPANATSIAMEPQWNGARNWLGEDRRPEQENISSPITLQAGERVYIEAQMNEGGGGDNLAVAVQKPSDPEPTENSDLQPIQGNFLSAFTTSGPVTITSAPSSQTVDELGSVTFNVEVDGTPPYDFHWMRDGEPIDGATSSSFTIDSVTLEDNGAEFSVEVSNSFSSTTSDPATLTVEEDLTAPTVESVQGTSTLDGARITFSEPVAEDTGGDSSNYSIEALSVNSATLLEDGSVVELGTSSQDEGTTYTITINNVTDRAAANNTIAADTTAQFVSWRESNFGVLWEAYTGIGGTSVSNLKEADKFPDEPDETRILSSFDMGGGGSFFGDNYGARMTAKFHPPETGEYRFFVRSDDASQLFISEDGTEEGLGNNPIAEETGCCNDFMEPGNSQTSDVISLTEGEPVLLRFLMKEGGGGDWGQVAFRLESDDTAPADLSPIPGELLSTLQPVASQPVVKARTPGEGASQVSPDTGISFALEDGPTAVNPDSIEVLVNGQSADVTVSEDPMFSHITLVELTATDLGSFEEAEITVNYEDEEGNPFSDSWSFKTELDPEQTFVDGTRYIEANDFNYTDESGNAGQWIEGANGGPTGEQYAGGEYEGLDATHNVDYHQESTGDGGELYRELDPMVGDTTFNGGDNPVRGGFTVESNWKIGWNAEGEWYNYTRDFPEDGQTYDVFASLSSGGTDPDPTLSLVTSDPSEEDQSTEQLGQFTGPASGDWGTAIFYKMHEVGEPEQPAQVELSGVNTVRLTVGPGNMDFNFLAFVPAEPKAEETVLNISLSEGNIEVTWDTAATLETASSVNGPWEPSDQSSPATFSIGDQEALFIRAVQ